MIRLAIVGYGNLGRGVEAAARQNKDMNLCAVFTRRDPSLRRQCHRPACHDSDYCPEIQCNRQF